MLLNITAHNLSIRNVKVSKRYVTFTFWKLYVLELLRCVQLLVVTLRHVTFMLCCFTLCINIVWDFTDLCLFSSAPYNFTMYTVKANFCLLKYILHPPFRAHLQLMRVRPGPLTRITNATSHLLPFVLSVPDLKPRCGHVLYTVDADAFHFMSLKVRSIEIPG